KPYLYSRVASCSMVSVDVDMLFSCVLSRSALRYPRRARDPRYPAMGDSATRCRDSHAERSPAPARPFGVRVGEGEALAHQAGVVVEGRTVDVAVALRIDEDLRPFKSFEDVIVFARRGFPGERVAQTRTSTCLDPDPQPTLGNSVPEGHLF